MSDPIIDTIQSAISAANRYPFLFIGSGLSKRYLGSPSWEPLLRDICVKTIGEDAYMRLRIAAATAAKADDTVAELPRLAALMESPVNDFLLTDPSFEQFRVENRERLLSGGSPMRMFVSQSLPNEVAHKEEELSILAEAGKDRVSGVITTNYDDLCERVFPEFKTYIGEDGLIFRDPTFARETYKIHGSSSEPDSIVITDYDYDRFFKRGRYLAAKLMTIFLEYPVIFLGYSIEDPNIQAILSEVIDCVGPKRLEELKNRLVFVKYGDGGASPVGTYTVSVGKSSLTMACVTTSDFAPVYEAIRTSKRLYSTRFIREIRGDIYKLASRVDPRAKVVVAGVDAALDSLPDDKEVVIGIGLAAGTGKPITVSELYEDSILDDKHFDPALVITYYADRLLAQNPGGLPLFKYLSSFDGELGERTAKWANDHRSVDSYRNKTLRKWLPGQRGRFASNLSVSGMIDTLGKDKAFKHLWVLEDDEIDPSELGSYLKDLFLNGTEDIGKREHMNANPEFRRMVRIYDLVKYGRVRADRKSPDLPH